MPKAKPCKSHGRAKVCHVFSDSFKGPHIHTHIRTHTSFSWLYFLVYQATLVRVDSHDVWAYLQDYSSLLEWLCILAVSKPLCCLNFRLKRKRKGKQQQHTFPKYHLFYSTHCQIREKKQIWMNSSLVCPSIFGAHSGCLGSQVVIHADFELNPDPLLRTRILTEPACRDRLTSIYHCVQSRQIYWS